MEVSGNRFGGVIVSDNILLKVTRTWKVKRNSVGIKYEFIVLDGWKTILIYYLLYLSTFNDNEVLHSTFSTSQIFLHEVNYRTKGHRFSFPWSYQSYCWHTPQYFFVGFLLAGTIVGIGVVGTLVGIGVGGASVGVYVLSKVKLPLPDDGQNYCLIHMRKQTK